MSQCEWILYESGHEFFMKASQILYQTGHRFFTVLTIAIVED